MPTTETLRTGKTLVDVAGNEDSSYSAMPTGFRSTWVVGLTSDGLSDDYAVMELGDNGQLDFDFIQDGTNRLPQMGVFDPNGGLTGESYGSLLTSHILDRGGDYFLNILSVTTAPNGRPYGFATVALPAGLAPSYSSLQTEADSTFLASARSDSTLNVVHLASSGALDLAFGTQGIATFTLPQTLHFDSETPLALQADGRLIVAGHAYPGLDADFSIARFSASGALDTTFGNQGTLTIDIAGGKDFARAAAVQEDGKLLIAGTSDSGNGNFDMSVIRLNADGSLDTTFGDNGKATVDFEGGRDTARTITVLDTGSILVTGSGENTRGNADIAALRLNADGSLDTTFGDRADGLHYITGRSSSNLLAGTDEDEVILGLGGNDLLDGGAGRDRLSGGTGSDVLRFSALADSYRTASQNFSDRIVGFDPAQDVLDLVAMGFTGLGDGHDHTLAVRTNASGTRTYLKSFDAEANGQRFELVLDGDLGRQLNESNIAFVTPALEGDDGRQRINATNLGSEVLGKGGDDNLSGGLGNDTLDGGAGRDVMVGGTGVDLFRYTALADSYRDASHGITDRILEFDVLADRIDVSALGFTGLGDGHNGTLAVVTSETVADTYLKSYDANASGQRFELTLAGDVSRTLSDEVFVFAAGVELLGVAEHEA